MLWRMASWGGLGMDMYETEDVLLDPGWLCCLLACWRMDIVSFSWAAGRISCNCSCHDKIAVNLQSNMLWRMASWEDWAWTCTRTRVRC
jgi:hypothetical protein